MGSAIVGRRACLSGTVLEEGDPRQVSRTLHQRGSLRTGISRLTAVSLDSTWCVKKISTSFLEEGVFHFWPHGELTSN